MPDARRVADSAASWLFVPGDRSDRFGTASRSGAHVVIIDLEDSVAPAHKEDARTAARRFIASQRERDAVTAVRTNPLDSDAGRRDLAVLAPILPHTILLVPKVDGAGTVARLCDHVPATTPVIPIIESAAALADVRAIAEIPRIGRLALGTIDLALDLEMDESIENLQYARSCLVTSSRAHRLPRPLDGVTKEYADLERIREDATYSRKAGFGGKLCIHPRQIAIVNEAFLPSTSEREWARTILETAGSAEAGATGVNGVMVDAPVVERARRILQRPLPIPTTEGSR